MILKKRYPVYILIGIFITYFISILYQSNLWGNILSPIVAFLCSFIIYKSLKIINKYKICWSLLFFYPFIWGVADFAWFVCDNLLSIAPSDIYLINILYTLPSLFVVIGLTAFYAFNSKKWNLYQLVLDLFAMSAILIVLFLDFMYSRTLLRFHSSFEYINTMVYLFFDFYLICGITVAFISMGISKINKSYIFILVGILIAGFVDFYYAFIYLMQLYEANTIIDGIYMISNVLFALGAFYEANIYSNKEVKNQEAEKINSENIRKPHSLVFAFIIFYILYSIKFFDFRVLLICSGIAVIYWFLTSQIQEGIRNKYLLKTELEINLQLEKVVEERTKELRELNSYLEEISNKDPLTGLYNRRYLFSYIDSLILNNENKPFTMLYIDINRFKSINDSYGHQIGDKVLQVVSSRFLDKCKAYCTGFRIGGDEFAVIIKNNVNRKYIDSIVEIILEFTQKPILLEPYLFKLTASIGIVSYPKDAKDKDLLMKYADIAMYEAKKACCGNNYLYFDSDLIKKIERINEIELLLRSAIYDKEFELYYQPQYSTKDQKLIGMEALLRWEHPEKGFISPGEFIPIAEESGAIIDIGEWVISKAFNQIKEWNNTYGENYKMSINVSPIQIENINFINMIDKKIQEEGLLPEWIDLEITESSAMNPNIVIEEVFTAFAHMGITTSIDDFGTGYSSLSHIKKFDVDRLKIAKELIDNISEDKNAFVIVQAIIMMAQGLGLKTIAEGVEETNQLVILQKLACDEIQGYIFGKPVPALEFEKEHINKKYNECAL